MSNQLLSLIGKYTSSIKRAAFWSAVTFVYGYLATHIIDQSFIQEARVQKSLLIAVVYATTTFLIILPYQILMAWVRERQKTSLFKILRVFALILAVIIIISTSIKIFGAISTGYLTDIAKWTDYRRSIVKISCISSYPQDELKNDIGLSIKICSCVTKEIEERWEYGNYRINQNQYIQQLIKEKVMLSCNMKAQKNTIY